MLTAGWSKTKVGIWRTTVSFSTCSPSLSITPTPPSRAQTPLSAFKVSLYPWPHHRRRCTGSCSHTYTGNKRNTEATSNCKSHQILSKLSHSSWAAGRKRVHFTREHKELRKGKINMTFPPFLPSCSSSITCNYICWWRPINMAESSSDSWVDLVLKSIYHRVVCSIRVQLALFFKEGQ